MRILIHCNGGAALGMGHVIRSTALGEEALHSDHEVVFAGRFDGDFTRRQLESTGAEVVDFAADRRSNPALHDLLEDYGPDVVHIDTYDRDIDVDGLSGIGRLTSNMEDGWYGRRAADLIVDPTIGSETEPRESSGGLLLQGSRYAPVRQGVTKRRGMWRFQETAERVLVVMGGTDPLELMPRVLRLLAESEAPLHVTAIVPAGSSIELDTSPSLDVELLAPVDDLAGLMLDQDLAVSAAGTSVWELCCLGVPMALVCAADNQRVGYERVVNAGAAMGLGSGLDEPGAATSAARTLRKLLADASARRALSHSASRVIDGLGAWRVVRAWEQLAAYPPWEVGTRSVRVRPALMSDARRLWDWRNDPATRGSSRSHAEVPFEDHLSWLETSLRRQDRLLLVGGDATGDIGTVRWDRLPETEEWEASITVAPQRRGESLAGPLLRSGELELCRATRSNPVCVAIVHERNAASLRLFRASGYLPDAPIDGDGFLRFVKKIPVRQTRPKQSR